MRIGIAALQGAVTEHVLAVRRAAHAMGKSDIETVTVRDRATFEAVDGLILPGGESTTISKLLRRFDLMEPIRQRVAQEDFPILGTCAGMVLMAKEGDQQVKRTDTELLGIMDIAVDRNAFGRQRESFEANLALNLRATAPLVPAHPGQAATGRNLERAKASLVPAVFIRAPAVTRAWNDAQILGTHQDKIIAVRQGRRTALSFHPELTDDPRVHQAFLADVADEAT